MPGSFTVRPIEAKLTHKTDLLGKMSPYVSINMGTQKFDSSISQKGNKNPAWNEIMTVPTTNEQSFILNVLDKDRVTKDDVIGSAQINMRDLQTQTAGPHWYPLFYNNKPAGEILLEFGLGQGNLGQFGQQNLQSGFVQSGFNQQGLQSGFSQQGLQSTYAEQRLTGSTQNTVINQRENVLVGQEPSRFFTEQHQSVQPHSFMKNVQVTETVPVQKQIEVMEARTVLRDVEYTQAVPVQKQIETVEPVVVSKTVEVMEPRLVNKTIEVIENVPVKRMVEVIEMKHTTQVVNTMEPQTFHKQVEVTEHVPVMRSVQVSEPHTVTRSVEFVEPVITTHHITKEIRPEIIVNEKTTTSVGPATVVRETLGQTSQYQTTQYQTGYTNQYQQQNVLTNQFSQLGLYNKMSEQERLLRDQQLMQKEGWTGNLDAWRSQRVCTSHRQFECDQNGCYNAQTYRWI